MNRTSKVTRALLMAALAVGLSACSGSGGTSGASVTATVTVTASATPSPEVSEVPSPSSSASPTALPEPPPEPLLSSSPSVPGSRGVDDTVRGQIALRGAGTITVTSTSDQGVKALLSPYTVVLDAQGLICTEGKAPHSCSVEQLRKALGKGDVLLAKVTIKDGLAVQIQEITKG
ncbi:hypothetical protein ACFQVD_25890 [Streptosporangium amethystogenes subsp. fukuiense]|uniref:DUF5666 domain-containing protein n=1 Tax=Streptosporangium amethystogenes subsp. fukuiense TaxID=698418 RepID=A0ABW2T752_9ACTN